MASLLKIDVSPRGDYSISRRLGNDYLAAWQAANPDATVVTRDLAANPLPFVDLGWIIGAYTDPATHGEPAKKSMAISNELVDELFAANEILITTPMYNFAIPSALKSWIDHIVRLNRTFSPSYEGLAKGKKVTVIVASAGAYAAGSGMEGMDFLTPYLKFIFGFIGITDVTIQFGYGTSAVDQGKTTLDDYAKEHTVPVA
jgi:FMN-dependent NADH-azoreductase